MKKVFFVTYGGGHVKIVIPVVKELQARGYDFSILGLTASVLALRKEGIAHKGLKDYIHLFKDKEQIYELGSKFIDTNFNPDDGLDKEEILLYLGLNIYDLGIQMGSIDQAITHFNAFGRKGFYPYHTMKKIIEYENPKAIFVTCEVRAEKAAAIIGNELNIEVVRVIDLLGEEEKVPYKAKVCVINELAKEKILNSNRHLNNADVVVTGQPNLETVYNDNALTEFNKAHHLNKYKKVLSFFSQPGNAQRARVVEKLIKLLGEKQEYLCFYKLHPNEDKALYEKYLEINPNNLLFTKEIDSNYILIASDIVMTFDSTVGLQAVYANKPLISINFSDVDYLTDYSKYGYAVKVKNQDSLDLVLERLSDPDDVLSKKLEVARRGMLMPKGSASRIADVVVKTMR
jgi:hypothetical protein